MDYVLFNVDSGDAFCLGKRLEASPNTAIGLDHSHEVFEAIADSDSFSRNVNLRDYYVKSSHLLSFILVASIGCQLIILARQDFEALCDEALQELQSEGKFVEARGAVPWDILTLNPESYAGFVASRFGVFEESNRIRKKPIKSLGGPVKSAAIDRIKRGLQIETSGPYSGYAVYRWGSVPPVRNFPLR